MILINIHYFSNDKFLIGLGFKENMISKENITQEELIEIANKNNKILMVGHLLHYHPCIEKIKEMIKQNKIGKVKNITANRLNLGIFRVQS